MASYKSLSDREITREVIENLLRDIFQEQARRAVTIEQIQRKVAEHFDVRLADMTSKRRPANIAFPRQVAMFLSRELTNSSLSDIGDAFGGKDHGTVIHACKLVKRRIEEDEQTRHVIRLLDSQLQRDSRQAQCIDNLGNVLVTRRYCRDDGARVGLMFDFARSPQ